MIFFTALKIIANMQFKPDGSSIVNYLRSSLAITCLLFMIGGGVGCADSPVETPVNDSQTVAADLKGFLESGDSDCGDLPLETCMTELLIKIEENVNRLTAEKNCESSLDCQFMALGHKLCGGALSHVLYSQLHTDEYELKIQVTNYNSLQRLFQSTFQNESVSSCTVQSPPTPSCVQHVCQLTAN